MQDVNMSNVYELGTSSGGDVNCQDYEQSFVVSSEVYNEYTSNAGRNLRVLMVQSGSVFDGGKGDGGPLAKPNFGQNASVQVTDRLCSSSEKTTKKSADTTEITFEKNDIGQIEVAAEPSKAAFVKVGTSLMIMLLVLVSW